MTEAVRQPLRVFGLVDLHWSGRGSLELPDLSDVDLVLLGGDLTHFKGIDVARRVVEQIRSAGADVLAVCGNCDRPQIEGYLDEIEIGLDRRARTVGGVTFGGLSAGLPFGGCPYERTEGEFAEAGAEVLEAVRAVAGERGPVVLVSHQPPHGTRCDRVFRLKHVGSKSVRRLIEELQPDLVLCGHIHESRGRDTIGRSVIVNPGPWKSGRFLRLEASSSGVELVESSGR